MPSLTGGFWKVYIYSVHILRVKLYMTYGVLSHTDET